MRTVYHYHVTYEFQSESTLYSWLTVEELLARGTCHIWSLSYSNEIQTHNHLVRKRTLSVRSQTKWLWIRISLLSLVAWGIWRIFTQPIKSLKISLWWTLFVKVCMVWAKKIQGKYLSWDWTVMQNLKKPWPCGFKNGMRN